MKILLVEDDWSQEDAIRSALTESFEGIEIGTISTESQFRESLDAIVADPPDLVIFDMMIRWADPSPDLDDSSEEYEVQTAGLRCQKLLAERAPRVRTLFFSILEKKEVGCDFPENVCYLPKGESAEPLLNKISKILGVGRRQVR